MCDQLFPSRSGLTDPVHREGTLLKIPNRTIDRGTREASGTGHERNSSSPQLFRINGSDKVLLSLIQVWKQQSVFLFEFVRCVHTNSIAELSAYVTTIYLQALTLEKVEYNCDNNTHYMQMIPWLLSGMGRIPDALNTLDHMEESEVRYAAKRATESSAAEEHKKASQDEVITLKRSELLKEAEYELRESYRRNHFGSRDYSTFSPWSFEHVSLDQFLADCQLVRRVLQGEPLRPAFLGPLPAAE